MSDLFVADETALRRLASDLSDIAPNDLERARAGFRRAYRVAADITEGRRSPLI